MGSLISFGILLYWSVIPVLCMYNYCNITYGGFQGWVGWVRRSVCYILDRKIYGYWRDLICFVEIFRVKRYFSGMVLIVFQSSRCLAPHSTNIYYSWKNPLLDGISRSGLRASNLTRDFILFENKQSKTFQFESPQIDGDFIDSLDAVDWMREFWKWKRFILKCYLFCF